MGGHGYRDSGKSMDGKARQGREGGGIGMVNGGEAGRVKRSGGGDEEARPGEGKRRRGVLW